MNKAYEISKIQSLLRVPISDVNFSQESVELISGTKRIGSIPYHTITGIIHYETGKNVVNWLKWELIYHDNEETILSLIKNLSGFERPFVTLAPFRGVYVRENEQSDPLLVTCSYDDTEWKVNY